MADTKELKATEEAARLRSEIRRLKQRLDRADSKQSEYVQVLRQAVTDCLVGYSAPELPPAPKDTRSSTAETAVVLLSDWQLGKRTPSYHFSVAEARVELLVQKVRHLIRLHRNQCPVRTIKVFVLGDILEGEFIFPGQAHLVDKSLMMQVTEGGDLLARCILGLAEEVEQVEAEFAIGNHGRLGRRGDFHPESNMDALLYEFAKRVVGQNAERGGRVKWGPSTVPGERKWFFLSEIGEHKFLGFHGDQVRGGFAGIPFYGFNKRLLGWAQMEAMYERERFDYAVCGHWHTPTRMFLNGITCWVNGSTESHNTYAAEQLAAAGRPSQWLLFVHPKNGVTAEYLLHLEKP